MARLRSVIGEMEFSFSGFLMRLFSSCVLSELNSAINSGRTTSFKFGLPSRTWMLTKTLERLTLGRHDPSGGIFSKSKQIRPETLQAIAAACSDCTFPNYPKELEAHLFFEYGSEDISAKTARRVVSKHYPSASFTVREGYVHCQYPAVLGEQYSKVLEEYLARGLQ